MADKPSSGTFAHADELDLRLATGELATGRTMLREAHAIVDRRQRAEAIKNALARLELASRAIDEVVTRRTT